MRKLLIAVVCLVALFTVKLFGQGTPKWSPYQGDMNWKDANAKCKKIGMKLPTRAEFKAAFDSNLTLDWSKNGAVYWTSETMSDEAIHVFVVAFGTNSNYRKDSKHSVRCIR